MQQQGNTMITTDARARLWIAVLMLLCPFASVVAHPADPTRGGAGGLIVRVTSLAKEGPGTLAEALSRKGRRIIVFEVAGAIDLARTTLAITEPYVTVAGQTAP